MNIEQMKQAKPMKYNEVKSTESDAQKKKLAKKIANGDYIATLKRDGCWYRFIKDEQGDMFLQSRTISKKTGEYTEKGDRVPHILKALSAMPNGTVLVGEICYPAEMKAISSDIIKVMGALPEKAIARQKNQPLYYALFDILAYDGEDISQLPYEKRMEKLTKLSEFDLPEFIELPELVRENIEDKIDEWLADGQEGAMLMDKSQPYHWGKRPKWVSVKYKQHLADDVDFVIAGFSKPVKEYTGKYPGTWEYWENTRTGELVEGVYVGQPNYIPVSANYFKNLVGGLWLGLYKRNGELVRVGKVANLTDGLREDITANPKQYLNRVVKISAMSIDYSKRSLRHPRLVGWHEDKNSEECIYEEVFG